MTPILETIISLVFVFIVFSLITSWIVEFYASRFQKRGKMLRQFLANSLDDPFNKNWGLLLYAHPLIEVLHHDIPLPKGFAGLFYSTKLNVKRKLPAYIPSDQFATALIDIVIQHNRMTKFRRNPVSGKYDLINEIVTDKSLADFTKAVDAMKESEVKITLATIIRKVDTSRNDTLKQLSVYLAEWYDNSMERLNGWYKQKIVRWLFMVGLLVAIGFNVDTITVVERLYVDPQLRASVANAAESYITNYDTAFLNTPETFDSLTIRIQRLKEEFDPLQLPIGWKSLENKNFFTRDFFEETWNEFKKTTSLRRLIGWILTAFALSFGAPFWFDVLKKSVNIRGAGQKPTSTTNISV